MGRKGRAGGEGGRGKKEECGEKGEGESQGWQEGKEAWEKEAFSTV